MRKGIIIGIGILITLLALAGMASAHGGFGSIAQPTGCDYCHITYSAPIQLTANGNLFNDTHKFNAIVTPSSVASCTQCHIDPTSDTGFGMTLRGLNYSSIHNGANTSGYARTVANCTYCHVNPTTGNFSLIANTGAYFKQIHKFNGVTIPNNATSCTQCHTDVMTFLPLTTRGQNYSVVHNGGNTSGYVMTGVNCTYCHTDPIGIGDFSFRSAGTTFKQIHKFNGVTIPSNATSCIECHTDVSTFLPLVSNGLYYNTTHRYNDTTLASELLTSPGCDNCHADINGDNFTRLSGSPTAYLTSTVCKDCHKAKYDVWRGTNHANKLITNITAADMNLSLPASYTWANISYVVIGLSNMYYLNESGYIFKKYYAANMSFVNYGPKQYSSCAGCHTTGYDATRGNQSNLPGIVGSWNETGIACEKCHNPGGNGHQVQTNVSAGLCLQCHSQKWSLSAHAPPLNAETSCLQCHSPFDYYKNISVNSTSATSVVCDTCHNPHDITADGYRSLYSTNGFNATTMAELVAAKEGAKLSFFNSTASLAAGQYLYDNITALTSPVSLFPGTDSRKDSNYGSAPINVTGPTSEVLCSLCHYKHGLGHIANVNLTHGRATGDQSKWATCTDCHMAGAGGKGNHSFNAMNTTDFPTNTCSTGTGCHVTSNQNRSLSDLSLISVQAEWKTTAHNDKETSVNHSNPNSSFYRSINGTTGVVTIKSRQNSCNKCHDPFNWDPTKDSNTTNVLLTNFKGITCTVCHDIHDMGDWINKTGKVYGWYNRDAIPHYNGSIIDRYKANYTVMANTIELCGNCHSNIRIGNEGPGWNGSNGNPTKPHGFPAKDVFVGSWKQSGLLNFECKDCHMYINKTNATGAMLNDTEKITGHSFAVNESGLQSKAECLGCHVNGTSVDTIANVIAKIQADTHTKWDATNITVQNALTAVKSYTGVNTSSRDKIAQAYWNLNLVSSDESWGVHDPVGTNKLLDDAAALAIAANASLGQATSNVQLKTGWNLVALNGTPSVTAPVSVMSSVLNDIAVVWSFNATTQAWELYDPTMTPGLNTLTSMVPGKGYWIYAKQDVVWTV